MLEYSGPLVSVNERYGVAKTGRLYLSPKYRNFVDALVLSFNRSGEKYGKRKIVVGIIMYCSETQDIDGSIKPVLDALQKAGVIWNDKMIYGLTVQKEISASHGLVVHIAPLEPPLS